MEQPSTSPTPGSTNSNREMMGIIIVLVVLLGFVGFGWLFRRMERLNQNLNGNVLGQNASSTNNGTPGDYTLPDGKGDEDMDNTTTTSQEPTDPGQATTTARDWYVVRTSQVSTKKGMITLRQECEQKPQFVTVPKAAPYQGTFCLGRSRFILLDPSGAGQQITSNTASVATSSMVFVGASVESLGDGNQVVLMTYPLFHEDWLSDDQGGAGQPILHPTYGYLVEQNQFYPIRPDLGSYSTTLWGGSGQAILVTNTCGGAGCMDPQALRVFNLVSGQINAVTSVKADYNNGRATKDVAGNKTQYWKTIRWANAKTIEAVYVGTDGKSQTLTINL